MVILLFSKPNNHWSDTILTYLKTCKCLQACLRRTSNLMFFLPKFQFESAVQLSESKLSRHAQLKPNGLENCHVFSTWSLQRTIKLIYLNNFEHLQQCTCVALCKCKRMQQGKIEKNNMCCNRNKITYFYTLSH